MEEILKKKILLIINSSSGLYKFRREFIENALLHNDVYLIANKSSFADKFKEMGCRFIESHVNNHGMNIFQEISLYNFYLKKIKEVNPDIVFTYTIKPNIYAGLACSKLGIPYVPTITGLGTAVEYPGVKQKLLLPLYRMAMKKAKKVFFQNAYNRDFMLQRKIVQGKNELLSGSGVNLDFFKLLEYPHGETVDFCFFSRIIKEKGIDQYLAAAEYIRKKYPNTRFHICGNMDNTSAYYKQIYEYNDLGIIIYHGSLNDVRPIHQISSCTVHPTFYPEGMSNVLLESAASGRPVITTDRPGCRETLEDGVSGYLVKQKDTGDLIQKIEKFLSLTWEQRRSMGLAGRKKVEKEFDRKVVIQSYMSEI